MPPTEKLPPPPVGGPLPVSLRRPGPKRRHWCQRPLGSFRWPAGDPPCAVLSANFLREWNDVGFTEAEFPGLGPAVGVHLLPPALPFVIAERFPHELAHGPVLPLCELRGAGEHLRGQGNRQSLARSHASIVAQYLAISSTTHSRLPLNSRRRQEPASRNAGGTACATLRDRCHPLLKRPAESLVGDRVQVNAHVGQRAGHGCADQGARGLEV